MFQIEIKNLNESFLRVTSNNPGVYDAIYEKFSFEVPGARFMPSYKDGSWDGFIRLFHYRDRTFPKGLGKELIALLKSDDYGEITFTGFKKPVDYTEAFENFLPEIMAKLPSHIDPYDYQHETCLTAANKKRAVVISPTSSGKSYMIYLSTMFALSQMNEFEKFLIIVPSITLVDQMFEDFKDYGYEGDAHLIVGGVKKDSHQRLYITTWQSIQRQGLDWFSQFGGVTVDEVHGATAKALKTSVEKCTRAHYRYGFTGTLSEFETDELVLRGMFGDKVTATTYQEMRDLGIIPEVEIEMVRVKYSDRYEHVAKACKGDFQNETSFVVSEEGRDDVLFQIMQDNADLNGIYLFKHIKHLERIEKLFKKHTNRPVVVINGGVARDVRAEIRRSIDQNANVGFRGIILLATYGTMSTGVSIKNLDYGVFAAPIKSKIKVLQSLGRILRKSTTKVGAKLYDIWDDLSNWINQDNYGKSHAKSRLRFYSEAGFDVKERTTLVP